MRRAVDNRKKLKYETVNCDVRDYSVEWKTFPSSTFCVIIITIHSESVLLTGMVVDSFNSIYHHPPPVARYNNIRPHRRCVAGKLS